jgi:hypothetical protein
MTAKALFAGKRAQQDMEPVISFLTTRVPKPTVQDWTKLVKARGFLYSTKGDKPRFQIDRMNIGYGGISMHRLQCILI